MYEKLSVSQGLFQVRDTALKINVFNILFLCSLHSNEWTETNN